MPVGRDAHRVGQHGPVRGSQGLPATRPHGHAAAWRAVCQQGGTRAAHGEVPAEHSGRQEP